MGKVLIIGAGGVGTVVAHKCAQNPEVFSEIVIASRTKEKCDRLAEKIGAKNIVTDQVDADSVEQLVELMNRHKPELVINVALPYQDLTIMDACLECGVNYLDTANYEPKDEAHFEYSWQWAYRERFEKAGLTLSGTSPDGTLVETVEITDRPFFVGVQYHPEFKSRPNKAHPLFRGFIEAALKTYTYKTRR